MSDSKRSAVLGSIIEYDIDCTVSEREIVATEARRAQNRWPFGAPAQEGWAEAIRPLVRIILAFVAALGAKTLREALARAKGLTTPVDVEKEVERVNGQIVNCDSTFEVMGVVRPIVEDRARLVREVDGLRVSLDTSERDRANAAHELNEARAELARLTAGLAERTTERDRLNRWWGDVRKMFGEDTKKISRYATALEATDGSMSCDEERKAGQYLRMLCYAFAAVDEPVRSDVRTAAPGEAWERLAKALDAKAAEEAKHAKRDRLEPGEWEHGAARAAYEDAAEMVRAALGTPATESFLGQIAAENEKDNERLCDELTKSATESDALATALRTQIAALEKTLTERDAMLARARESIRMYRQGAGATAGMRAAGEAPGCDGGHPGCSVCDLLNGEGTIRAAATPLDLSALAATVPPDVMAAARAEARAEYTEQTPESMGTIVPGSPHGAIRESLTKMGYSNFSNHSVAAFEAIELSSHLGMDDLAVVEMVDDIERSLDIIVSDDVLRARTIGDMSRAAEQAMAQKASK